MNKIDLKKAAENLEKQFMEGDLPSSIKNLEEPLNPIIQKSKAMEVGSPVDENSIPGAYHFGEGLMRGCPDFEEAYVEFRIQVSGGVSPEMQDILDSMSGKG